MIFSRSAFAVTFVSSATAVTPPTQGLRIGRVQCGAQVGDGGLGRVFVRHILQRRVNHHPAVDSAAWSSRVKNSAEATQPRCGPPPAPGPACRCRRQRRAELPSAGVESAEPRRPARPPIRLHRDQLRLRARRPAAAAHPSARRPAAVAETVQVAQGMRATRIAAADRDPRMPSVPATAFSVAAWASVPGGARSARRRCVRSTAGPRAGTVSTAGAANADADGGDGCPGSVGVQVENAGAGGARITVAPEAGDRFDRAPVGGLHRRHFDSCSSASRYRAVEQQGVVRWRRRSPGWRGCLGSGR